MKKTVGKAAVVVMGLLLSAAWGASVWSGSAWAASASTDAFVAAVRPNVDILDRTSRLALDRASQRLRRFAHRQAIEQTIADNSLVAWSQANTAAGAEVALGTPIHLSPAPLAEITAETPAATPADTSAVPAGASGATQGVVTGRSVAVDTPSAGRPLTVTRAPRPAVVAPDFSVLARLSALNGAQFDSLYLSVQRVSLNQLAMLYADYARGGDDPALRALATRERPKINRRLEELRKY